MNNLIYLYGNYPSIYIYMNDERNIINTILIPNLFFGYKAKKAKIYDDLILFIDLDDNLYYFYIFQSIPPVHTTY